MRYRELIAHAAVVLVSLAALIFSFVGFPGVSFVKVLQFFSAFVLAFEVVLLKWVFQKKGP